MKIVEVIAELRSCGITLAGVGCKLAVDGPEDRLTPKLLAYVRANKAALRLAIQANPHARRVMGVIDALNWEGRHIARARAMIHAAASDPEHADELYRLFSGAWTVALCFRDSDEQGAVDDAFDALRLAMLQTEGRAHVSQENERERPAPVPLNINNTR